MSARKLVAGLVLACALISAQSASIVSEQIQHHSSQHCCGLCHAGPLPFVQPPSKTEPAPARFAFWLESTGEFGAPSHAPLASGDSRAPPTQVLHFS